LTVNEIRRLFAKLMATTTHTIDHWLTWSRWRRLHQARARTSDTADGTSSNNQPASTYDPGLEYQCAMSAVKSPNCLGTHIDDVPDVRVRFRIGQAG